jgi:hypothetical protein
VRSQNALLVQVFHISSLWLSCIVCWCAVGTFLYRLLVCINYRITVCFLILRIIDLVGTTQEPLCYPVGDTVDAVVSIETCLSVVLCVVLYCIVLYSILFK